jgi:ribosomal protein L32
MKNTLNDAIEKLRFNHSLSDEAIADIRKQMAYYAFSATIDSVVRDEAINEMREEHRQKSDEFHRKYKLAHALCPKCGHDKCSSTYAGYILNLSDPDAYRDENRTVCSQCKHTCTRHERISTTDWKWVLWERNRKA